MADERRGFHAADFQPEEGNKPNYMYANDKPGALFVKGIIPLAEEPVTAGRLGRAYPRPVWVVPIHAPGWLGRQNRL
jgi:hypothetical protein